ncbi:D-aminoacyl-tRNA deacylase 1 isoform X3 [Lampetra planeri]
MKAVVQRVAAASVSVAGEQVSSIGRGLCVLLGISRDDTEREIDFMVRKILGLRVFEGADGRPWSSSVAEARGEVLCVSQFTLQAVLKGNKPDFHLAMAGERAEPFYHLFLERLRSAYSPELVKDGKFGALMRVHIENDGPVTIQIESPLPCADPKQSLMQQMWCCIGQHHARPPLSPHRARYKFEAELT